jgi:membrane associated rhomboid family serine protease
MRSTWGSPTYETGWLLRPTPVVLWLIIINFAVFCIQKILGHFAPGLVETFFALSGSGIRHGFIWQFLTYAFLHGDVFHVLMNLLILYFFGNEVEATLGPKKFLQLYFSSALVAGLIWFLVFSWQNDYLLLGASGAVYAVVIAFATMFPDRPITLLIFFVLPLTLLAKYLAIGIVAISVMYVFSGFEAAKGGGIAHLAHLGGMAMGYIFIKALNHDFLFPKFSWPKRKPSNPNLHILKTPEQHDEFIQKQIDPILDKIAAKGMQSLSAEERRILKEAKDRLSEP